MIPHKVDFNLSSPLDLEQQQSQILSHGPRVEPGQKMGQLPSLETRGLKVYPRKQKKIKGQQAQPS